MKDIPRFIPIWLLPLILLIILISITQCGCRTGGIKLNPNSAGKIIKPKSHEQINKEVKAKREEAERLEQAKPQPIKPVKIEPVKSRPVTPAPASAKAEIKPADAKASNPKTKFRPTVTDVANLQPTEVDSKSTTVLIPILPESKGIDNSGKIIINEKAPVEMNWLHLFSLFMILFTGALILWVAYDIIKDIFNMKKQGTPMKDHLDNLKKPAKGTKTSRKKAVSKKKVAKKKNQKKKD